MRRLGKVNQKGLQRGTFSGWEGF